MLSLRHISHIVAAIIAMIIPATALSHDAKADSVKPTIEMSILACGPGCEIYELEGHSALRIRTPEFDATVNWGLFDFAAPNFVYRFVKGETDYSAGETLSDLFIAQYVYEGRDLTEYRLNLTDEEARAVMQAVAHNLLPENRVYRYNYVKDNCSTRIIRIIEQATGGKVDFSGAKLPEGATPTWRGLMSYYHRNYPWYQFGIDLALGTGIDVPVDQRGAIYAPVLLGEFAPSATITMPDGEVRPLVTSTRVLNAPDREAVLPPTPWYLTPMAAAILLLVITLAICIIDIRRRCLTRIFDTILYSVAGIGGLIIAFLVFISVHEATTVNFVILWLNPLIFLIAIGVWFKRLTHFVVGLQILNAAGVLTFAAVWIMGIQIGNPAFAPILLADLIRAATDIYLLSRPAKS